MMNGYYIQKNQPTVKIPLDPQESIYLESMNIIELVLPECEYVYCWNNNLTKLIIPEGCEYVDCSYNQISKLIIPMGCEEVYCQNNNLTKLIIPESCRVVCYSNKLPQIIENLFQSGDSIKIELANNLQTNYS